MSKKNKNIIFVWLVFLFLLLFSSRPLISYAMETSEKYGYNQLTTKEKNVYKKILKSVKEQKASVEFKNYKDYDNLGNIYTVVTADNPEIFWVKKVTKGAYTKKGKTLSTFMKFTYTMSKDKVKSKRQKVEKELNKIIGNMPSGSNYDKIKYLYETVIDTVSYDKENMEDLENQRITSAVLNKKSVCAGYSRMYTYLLQKAGYQAMTVQGKAKGYTHLWTLLRIDDNYYCSDVTFGDIEFKNTDDKRLLNHPNYTYLLCSSEDFNIDHKAKGNYIKLPNCKDNLYNYFVKEDLLFEDITEESKQKVQEKIDNGEKVFQIRLVDDSFMPNLRTYLYQLDTIYGISIAEERNVVTIYVE